MAAAAASTISTIAAERARRRMIEEMNNARMEAAVQRLLYTTQLAWFNNQTL